MFYLISGAAATGKSGLIKKIKGVDKNLECHDFDEILVEDEHKRRMVLEEWIQRALLVQSEGRDFLLSGHTPLGELLACPSAIKLDGIKCCLLDCNDYVRVERYLNRPQFEEWPLGMDTLCWAVFHRMHANDPQWEQRVVVNKDIPELKWERWTGWQKGDERWDVKVIDTTENEMEYTANLVQDWILEEKSKTQTLTPETKWWE